MQPGPSEQPGSHDRARVRRRGPSNGRGRGAPLLAAALGLGLIACPPAAQAADDGIMLELNRLEAADDGCRVTMLSTNGLDADLERLVVELVLFDGNRQAVRFMRVALSALPAQRSRAQVFSAGDVPCTGIASVLLNGAVECIAAGVEPNACAEAVTPSSRAEVPFVTGFAAADTPETQ